MILYWLLSYLLGNFMTAWWVGKWKRIDLRDQRSGNLGARNAGAVIGKTAFIITFLGDAFKGVIVIYFGHLIEYPLWSISIGGLFVILGHLFPIWLKGKGGKGISTFIGVGLTLDPILFITFIVGTAITIPFLKSATLSMLFGYAMYSICAVYFYDWITTLPIFVAILFIVARHRFDVKESFGHFNRSRKAK